jgi:uncharacterized protein
MSRRSPLAVWTSAAARRPYLSLVLLVPWILPLLIAAGGLRPDNSLELWFVRDDPALLAYRSFLGDFGSDEAVVIAYPTPAGPDARELALQRELAGRLQGVDGVGRVLSAADLAGATTDALHRAGLAGPDGRTLAVVAWMDVRPDADRIRGEVLDGIRREAEAVLGADARNVRVAGVGVVYEALNRQTLRDTGLFMTLALLLMVVLLWATLRRWTSVVIAMAPALLAAGAALGLLSVAGRPLTMVTAALPTLVLVIALADAIHFIHHVDATWLKQGRAGAGGWRQHVAASAATIAVPCLYTSITTAAAFLALASSRIVVTRDFGLFAAAGMLLAWTVTTWACTAALALRGPPAGPLAAEQHGLAAGLERLVRNAAKARRRVIAGWAAAALVLSAGVLRLHVDTLTIGMLPADHEVRVDSDWIEANLGYYTPLEFTLRHGDGAHASRDTAAVLRWREAIGVHPAVGRTFGWPEAAGMGAYTSRDGTRDRVTAFVPMMSARGFDTVGAALAAQAGDGGAGLAAQGGGYLPLYVRIIDYVVQGTVVGLALAFGLVFIVLGLWLRSWRLLAAAVPANLFPVLLVFGMMGWAGTPLDIATATVGAIVLGIAVDNTVHFLFRFRHERAAGRDPLAAVAATARETGRAMTFTTLVLAVGFGVMMASGSASVAAFGMVMMLAVLGALVADLALLPALLVPGRSRVEAHR